MRSQEEIRTEYEATKENDEIVLVANNISEYKNEQRRRELHKEFVQTLPLNQRIALKLHSATCCNNHTDGCMFYYEVNGLDHDWNGYNHKRYLEKADEILKACQNEKAIFGILDVIESLPK